MGQRKNHVLDALSDIHNVVDGFEDSIDMECDYDDGESHTKKEAREVATTVIDGLIGELEELKAEIKKKYK